MDDMLFTAQPKEFKALGWYLITTWAKTCPECGVRRSGTPGTYMKQLEEDDAAPTREEQVRGFLEHTGVSWRGDLPENEEEVREGQGGQAGDRGEPGERSSTSPEVRITGAVRATFHQFLGEHLGYIDVQIPEGWEVYAIGYADKKKTIIDVMKR